MGSVTPLSSLPYWQINVPLSQREVLCPPFLQNLKPKDLNIISTPDEDYRILKWSEVQKIVGENALDVFQRVPSELRRYFAYNYQLKQSYGSVMNFILKERLQWTLPITSEGKPFEKAADVKILWNDWPYGLDERIVHLVVWTKFDLEDDPATDDLTDEARKGIEDFVDTTFRKKVGTENVIWFKNWRTLKSIESVEHFHVMLFDPDPMFVEEITNGDVPLSKKV